MRRDRLHRLHRLHHAERACGERMRREGVHKACSEARGVNVCVLTAGGSSARKVMAVPVMPRIERGR